MLLFDFKHEHDKIHTYKSVCKKYTFTRIPQSSTLFPRQFRPPRYFDCHHGDSEKPYIPSGKGFSAKWLHILKCGMEVSPVILKCTQNSLYIQIMTFKGQRYTGTQVIEVKQLKSDPFLGLRLEGEGCNPRKGRDYILQCSVMEL